MVFFTLQITNDRTQFALNLCVSIWNSCDRIRLSKKSSKNTNDDTQGNDSLYQMNNMDTSNLQKSVKIV